MSTTASRMTGSLHDAALALLTGTMLVVTPVGEAEAHGVLATLAQDPGPVQETPIVSSEINISQDGSELALELRGGRELVVALENGRVLVDGAELGEYERGDELDQSWRELLNTGISRGAGPAELSALLADWVPPSGAEALRDALADALAVDDAAVDAPAVDAVPAAPVQDVTPNDSVHALEERISDLREEVRSLQREAADASRSSGRPDFMRPFRHIISGLGRILSTLVLYAVLAGIGFATVYFGHSYLERVADTARRSTVRSGLVGIATSFLLLPAFVVGTIGLAISIIGIPLILVWVVLFPVGVAIGALLGYVGVAHAAGEAFAERRFYKGNWFQHSNSYYYVLSGFGLLLALFMAAHIVGMAGPWLGFIRGSLHFLGIVLTWLAVSVGLGAVVISRAGTRSPATPSVDPDMSDILEEESHV